MPFKSSPTPSKRAPPTFESSPESTIELKIFAALYFIIIALSTIDLSFISCLIFPTKLESCVSMQFWHRV